MNRHFPILLSLTALWLLASSILLGAASSPTPIEYQNTTIKKGITLFIAGDSTAAVNSSTQQGWGIHFQDYFDPAKLTIINAARSGLSTRTFISSGAWDAIVNRLQPHDYVIIQFGHNDNGPLDSFRFRGTLPSLGEETQQAHNAQGQPETVHTFGWYLRKMISDVKTKNASPILISMTPRGEWTDGKIERGFGPYARLAGDLAKSEGVRYFDLTNFVADQYQQLGPQPVTALFPSDTTHTNNAGANINAHAVISGIRALHEYALINALSATGRAIDTAPANYALPPQLAVPKGQPPDIFDPWLNLPDVPNPQIPTLFLIGDSTVRNGRGDGVDRQWGWGDPLAVYFDPAKINLVNRAVGGTTAGSFYSSRWPAVQKLLKPGDIVLMQFGTNNEAQKSFMDSLRNYIADCRAQKVTPILCTLVPRNTWGSGKLTRTDPHAPWVRTVAQDEKIQLLDLNNLIADQYDTIGRDATTALFESGPHTNRAGAEFTAKIIADAVTSLPETPLTKYLRDKPAQNW
jgi:lysophospholipase L1-like esterase